MWFWAWLALPAVAFRGDPSCWIGSINYQFCCPPGGNPQCWDATYSYERCCLGHGRQTVDINAVAEISELGGCELNIFQEFKVRAGSLRDAPALQHVIFLS